MNFRSNRKEHEKREDDIAFLARVRAASPAELHELAQNHSHKSAPPWKKAAIARALARVYNGA